MRPNPRQSSRGTTLAEVVLALSLGAGMLLVLAEIVDTTARTQHQITMQDRASEVGQDLLTDLRSAAFSSRRIFSDDAEGRSFLAALDTTGLPPLAGTRLPLVAQEGRLEPDVTGTPRTGNALLLAVEDRPLDLVVSGVSYRIDQVRFVAFYLTPTAERVVRRLPGKIDLVRFTSRTYADRASLDAITDPTARAEVVQAVRAEGVDRAWTSGAAASEAFFALAADGSIGSTAIATPTIASAVDWPPRELLRKRRMSIAANDAEVRVPRFALPDTGFPEFPGGFEVKVVGPSGARQALARLVLLCGAVDGNDYVTEITKVLTVRDL